MSGDDITVLRLGTYIESNGGYVQDFKPGSQGTSVVLCFLANNKVTPWVVHTYDERTGVCYKGDYCWTLDEAIETYKKRIY